MERNTSPRKTRRTGHRRDGVRTQRRSRNLPKVNDFDQASEFLHHFHAITSRSLDVIHETNDFDNAEDLASSDIHGTPSFGLSSMRRTKTCSCLLEAQYSATVDDQQDWFSEESKDEDEWGFYSEESDTSSWSASTLQHSVLYFRR